ncbi:hypothetical protein CCZ01_08295 [Helicobacter monodelphidis]|uniref:hypothetical protein n=1 Tax=Helicobacter sp. 15-1451 TaxID=2004995 RepID=UPI000DCF0495|nr:hypothetical protein [Helicobacter sp. 15-1451]RAX56848.1 hypothetical protein CCZ01_08295 [Helicobacter sp. 15-1451]
MRHYLVSFIYYLSYYSNIVNGYVESKKTSEKIILYALFVAFVWVLSYAYLQPIFLAFSQQMQQEILYKKDHAESEKNQKLALRQIQNTYETIEKILQKIEEESLEIQQQSRIWKNILSEISKILITLQINKDKMSVHREDMRMNLSGYLNATQILVLIEHIQNHIPLVDIVNLQMEARENRLFYQLEFQNVMQYIPPRNMHITDSEWVARFLETKEFLEELKPVVLRNIDASFALQDLKPIQPAHQTEIIVQAILGEQIKINHLWLQKGDSLGDFQIIDIQECGVILRDKQQQEECYPLYLKNTPNYLLEK